MDERERYTRSLSPLLLLLIPSYECLMYTQQNEEHDISILSHSSRVIVDIYLVFFSFSIRSSQFWHRIFISFGRITNCRSICARPRRWRRTKAMIVSQYRQATNDERRTEMNREIIFIASLEENILYYNRFLCPFWMAINRPNEMDENDNFRFSFCSIATKQEQLMSHSPNSDNSEWKINSHSVNYKESFVRVFCSAFSLFIDNVINSNITLQYQPQKRHARLFLHFRLGRKHTQQQK